MPSESSLLSLDGYRISPQQARLWALQQSDSIPYRAQVGLKIKGDLQIHVLKVALQQVVNRHESLRTTFHRQPGISLPIQIIAATYQPSWQQIDLRDLAPQPQRDQIKHLLQLEKQYPLNFEHGPLLRALLLALTPQHHLLFITLPALCSDRQSLNNIAQDIGQIYVACLQPESYSGSHQTEVTQYLQFSEWQHELLADEADAAAGITYWQQQKFDTQPALKLPFATKLSAETPFQPDVYALYLDASQVGQLEAIAQHHKSSLANVLLTSWIILLWRIIQQSTLILNIVVNNRDYEELEETVGLLAKWLPLQFKLQPDFTFNDVLNQVTATLQTTQQQQEYYHWQSPSNPSVPNVIDAPISFEFITWPEVLITSATSFSVNHQYSCSDRYQLNLTCSHHAHQLVAELHYNTHLFQPDDIHNLAECLETLLTHLYLPPAQPIIRDLELVSDRHRHQLLNEFALSPPLLLSPSPPLPYSSCIHHYFEYQAHLTPNNLALVYEDQTFTYQELNHQANQLAYHLQTRGVGPDVLVGLYLERSPDLVVAILAVLKAGGAYLPLDPALPLAGLKRRLQSAQPLVLLSQQSLQATLASTTILPEIIYIDTFWDTLTQVHTTNPVSQVAPANLVYVMFTSGSTGHPKGVAIEHRQLLNYYHGIQARLALASGSKFATVSTFAADLGNTIIFSALCGGGCLHVISQARASDPLALVEYLYRHGIDCLKIVPSHLTSLLAAIPNQTIVLPQRLILGGEAAAWELVKQLQQRALGNHQILNHYGPTETTVGVLTHSIESLPQSVPTVTVPLGRPLAQTQVYVLDAQLRLVPMGVPGELYIGGLSLARGYWQQPALTATRFVPHPFSSEPGARLYKTGDRVRYLTDGTLEFLGRTDQQVKIRGFRIEPREIEVLLSEHPAVQQSVVMPWEHPPGSKRLVAYLVWHRDQSSNVTELRHFLREQLPEYMVPAVFLPLKQIPLTANGKVNRQALPDPKTVRQERAVAYVAPRTDMERTIATVWQETLRLEQVGMQDNFFDLGGHS
ncbi:MAG: amino acid adenylation domain-containing protein [Cyanothece sp. SIO1E1]|nr:amino acid adenylation domain-containing protein [Cyanothece sp. SIO1E1]